MTSINIDSPSVQSYLNILQGVISRMAANSSACKTWCVALVSAIVVVVADKGTPELVWISVIPIALLLFLDAYYLGLERQFRDIYNGFIRKVHGESAVLEDVFIVAPNGGLGTVLLGTAQACASLSVWPFYGLMAAILELVRRCVLPSA